MSGVAPPEVTEYAGCMGMLGVGNRLEVPRYTHGMPTRKMEKWTPKKTGQPKCSRVFPLFVDLKLLPGRVGDIRKTGYTPGMSGWSFSKYPGVSDVLGLFHPRQTRVCLLRRV